MSASNAGRPLTVEQVEAELRVLTRLEGGPVRFGAGTVAAFFDAVQRLNWSVERGAETNVGDQVGKLEEEISALAAPASADIKFRRGVTVPRILKAVHRCGFGVTAQAADGPGR